MVAKLLNGKIDENLNNIAFNKYFELKISTRKTVYKHPVFSQF